MRSSKLYHYQKLRVQSRKSAQLCLMPNGKPFDSTADLCDDDSPDANQTAAIHVAAVTGTSIPKASDLTDDAELLARYEAAKAKEAARRKRH